MSEVSAQVSLLEEQCHLSGNERLRFLADEAFKKAHILEQVLNDIYQRSEIERMK